MYPALPFSRLAVPRCNPPQLDDVGDTIAYFFPQERKT